MRCGCGSKSCDGEDCPGNGGTESSSESEVASGEERWPVPVVQKDMEERNWEDGLGFESTERHSLRESEPIEFAISFRKLRESKMGL